MQVDQNLYTGTLVLGSGLRYVNDTDWEIWIHMTTTRDTATPELSLTGVIDRVVFQSDDSDFAVAIFISDEDEKPMRMAGDLGDVEEGETVSVIGRLVIDPRFGPQLKVSAIAPQLPYHCWDSAVLIKR